MCEGRAVGRSSSKEIVRRPQAGIFDGKLCGFIKLQTTNFKLCFITFYFYHHNLRRGAGPEGEAPGAVAAGDDGVNGVYTAAAVVEQVHSVCNPGDREKLSPMGMTSQVEVIPFFCGFPDAQWFMVHDDIEPGCIAVRYCFRREMDIVIEAGESYARGQLRTGTAQEVTEGKGLFLFFYVAVKKVVVAKDRPDAKRGFEVLQVAVTAVAEDKGQMGVDEVATEEDGIGLELPDTADEAPCVPVALQGPHMDIRKEGQTDRRDCFFRLDHDVTDDRVDGFIDAPGHDREDQEEQYEGKTPIVCLPERIISQEKAQKIQYGIYA